MTKHSLFYLRVGVDGILVEEISCPKKHIFGIIPNHEPIGVERHRRYFVVRRCSRQTSHRIRVKDACSWINVRDVRGVAIIASRE